MEVKLGYKKTEVGMIPKDWEVKKLGKVVTLQRGYDLPRRLRKSGSFSIVTSSGIEDFHCEAKVRGPGVVTGRYGTIGEVFWVPDDFWPLNTTLYVRNFFFNIPLFIFHLLRAIDFKPYSGKSGVPGVNRNDLHEILVPLPPTIAEQRAIATALSDVDSLIAALDRLIAKKRDIKQAAMQELLTGQKRLPGFACGKGYKQTEVGLIPAEWTVRRLGEVVEFLDGLRRPVKDSDRAQMRGDYPYYGASGIIDYVDNFIFDEDLILLGEDGENILSRNIRLAFRVSGKIWVNNHAHVLRPRTGIDIDYLTEYLESIDYEQYNSGTAQPKLNKQVCSNIPVLCPTYEEQTAIASIFSNMDAEIAALESRREKTRALKEGMMQELLTGRIRLVQGAEA